MNVVKFVKYMLQMFSLILEFAANNSNELIYFLHHGLKLGLLMTTKLFDNLLCVQPHYTLS
jgi:hypothetical protein